MDIRNIKIDNYYRVVVGEDYSFRAIIALHKPVNDLCLGGCRFMKYDGYQQQLDDTLRLAEGMTNKCAAANVPAGGGKSTILAGLDISMEDTYTLFSELLNYVNTTDRYLTGGDIGTGDEELKVLGKNTKNLLAHHSAVEDTGLATAYGVFVAMKTALGATTKGKVINIQGMGKVGARLAKLCLEDGASIIISDINFPAVETVIKDNYSLGHNIFVSDPISSFTLECDVLSPCSIGGTINDDTVDSIKASVICGGANNQLSRPNVLDGKDVIYVQDYVANAGGLIIAHSRMEAKDNDLSYNNPIVLERLNNIANTTKQYICK